LLGYLVNLERYACNVFEASCQDSFQLLVGTLPIIINCAGADGLPLVAKTGKFEQRVIT